jgi:hypothetical protein
MVTRSDDIEQSSNNFGQCSKTVRTAFDNHWSPPDGVNDGSFVPEAAQLGTPGASGRERMQERPRAEAIVGIL